MGGDVKNGPARSRDQRAAGTRRAIVDSAYRLFSEQGYPGTTMEMIARSAGVAVQTVYYVFRTKALLLQEVIQFAGAGEHDPLPVTRRPWMLEVLSAGGGHRALALSIEHGVDIYARLAPLGPALAAAAAADPAVSDFEASIAQQRRRGMLDLITPLAERGELRPGLTAERATDLMFVIDSFPVFLGLVRDAGWPLPEFKAWLFRTMCQQLLAHPDGIEGASGDLSFHGVLSTT